MDVLVIGKFSVEHFGAHIADSLENLGHSVICYDPSIPFHEESSVLARRVYQIRSNLAGLLKQIPAFQRLQTQKLLKLASSSRINLTIVTHDFLMPAEVKALKAVTGSPVVMWFPDHMNRFERAYFLNAAYDGLFFKDPFIVWTLRSKLALPIHYLPECCNPRFHRPCPISAEEHSRYDCDLTTAGNTYTYRVAFFTQLNDYRVKLWGNPAPLWMDDAIIKGMSQNRFVAYDEKSKAFNSAKIVVNNLNPGEVWGVNVRAFEAAAVGAFQLVDYRPGLKQLFEEGLEIVSFRDMSDLKKKIKYYLERPEERLAIAQRGMVRAHRDHTYENRLGYIFDTVFGDGRGYPMPAIPTW